MKWFWRLLFTLTVVVAVVVVGLFIVGRQSLPVADGKYQLKGISAPVRVVRDRFAIPHIEASNRADALFALGFVHAQDRLWQMEFQRRVGQGRLSEFAGESTLKTDIFLRTLGVYRAAERTFDNLDSETRNLLTAYTAGINAFLESNDALLPPEFLILQVEPEPWKPADTLVWLKMMAWDLSGNWVNEARRAALARRLSPQQVRELWPDYPADAPIALAVAGGPDADSWDHLADLNPFPSGPGIGSNNWVISGKLSATGKPLLANDPHLGLQAPAVWYFAHIDDGTDATIGATLPGVPFVVLGRNRHVAWGFTNTYPDTQDLYIEQLDPEDPNRYRTPNGWTEFKTRQETIRVNDGNDVTITVRETRHGPVISDAAETMGGWAGDGHVVALRWHVLDDDEMTVRAGLNLHKATDWSSFRNALRDFHNAQQNVVYADVDGNIGYVAAGRVPIRGYTDREQGMMPVPGWFPAYDHVGYIPFDDLPTAYNPEKGYIATANNRIIDEDYPYFLTNEWAAPYRARRIKDLLEARQIHSVESFRSMQADQVSLFARQMLPLMRRIAPVDPALKQIVNELALWDGSMQADRTEPTIFTAWYLEFVRQVIVDETAGDFDQVFGFRPTFIHNVLTDTNGSGRWCDDVATEAQEDCGEILERALGLALAGLETRYGSDREGWRWGDLHAAVSRHNPFSRVEPLDRLFNIEVPVGGDSFTVNVSGMRPKSADAPLKTVHGASLRAIYDLDHPDASLFIHSTGQSGHLLSPHYDDFAERWRLVDYLPMTMRPEDYGTGAEGVLSLRPLN